MKQAYLSKLYTIALLSIPNIGKKTVQNIIQNLTFCPSNLQELREVLLESTNAKLEFRLVNEDILEKSLRRAEEILEDHEKAQVKVIAYCDPDFPQRLLTIPDRPLILYVKGNIDCLKPEQSVAVIGTRNPTDYGRERAIRIAQKFAEKGLIVVSGLADGCDTAAHEGCLRANGRTVAVLAHGLQMIYPAHNRNLAGRIVDSGGCIVSEYQLGTKPFKNLFVERDRLQSGLSAAVVVIETDIKGGTMHTARFCLEQNRTLACIDHVEERRSEKSRGNQKLILEKKAIPLRTPEQLENFITKVFGKLTISQIAQEPIVTETPASDTELITSKPAFLETTFAGTYTVTVETEPAVTATTARESASQEICIAASSTSKVELPTLAPDILEASCLTDAQAEIERVLAKDEGEKVTFEAFLNKDEIQSFEARCKQNNKTTAQIVTELIREYLHPGSKKSKNLSRNKRTGKSNPQAKQLELLDQDRLTQKELANLLKVEEGTIIDNQKKGTDHFRKWSQEKDPKKRYWEYSETSQFYEVAF